MKLNKTSPTKSSPKLAVPARMQSALTNLDRIVQPLPEPEKPQGKLKLVRKSRATEPTGNGARTRRFSKTVVEAKIDVGFGNMLFIRGQGSGLSWEKGVPLDCRDNATWLWSTTNGQEPVEFKLLLNDEVWAAGDNVKVAPGEKIEVVPTF